MHWPFRKQSQGRKGSVAAIFVAPAAGESMQSRQSVAAVAGVGLEGDRYAAGRGFWKATDACQVTLISEHDLGRARSRDPQILDKLAHGHHRRNLVLRDLNTRQLRGRRFRIGSAVFVFGKPRPPCGYLDQVEGKGLCSALGRNSGVCVRVVQSGVLRVGDAVELLDDEPQPARRAQRAL